MDTTFFHGSTVDWTSPTPWATCHRPGIFGVAWLKQRKAEKSSTIFSRSSEESIILVRKLVVLQKKLNQVVKFSTLLFTILLFTISKNLEEMHMSVQGYRLAQPFSNLRVGAAEKKWRVDPSSCHASSKSWSNASFTWAPEMALAFGQKSHRKFHPPFLRVNKGGRCLGLWGKSHLCFQKKSPLESNSRKTSEIPILETTYLIPFTNGWLSSGWWFFPNL